MTINLILLFALIFAALWTVTTPRLIRAIVGLALTSAILSVIMYRLNSPLAAVFELSVCSGLIPVIFVITISFTQRVSKEELLVRRKQKFLKYWCLPLILIAAGLLLNRFLLLPHLNTALPVQEADVRTLIWNTRHLDLFGQAVILLVGALGVVALFKEPKK
jgi:NADH-quinone oxidoreductase subunit J